MTHKYIIGALAAVIGAIFAYYGITADSLTTWGAVFELVRNAVMNPAAIIAGAGAIYAYYKRNTKNGDGE